MMAVWEDLHALRPERRAELLNKARAFVDAHPLASLDHEPDWIAARGAEPGNATRCFACVTEAGEVVGFAPFLVHPSALTVDAGPLTLLGYGISRYSITGRPLVAADLANVLIGALFTELSRILSPREVPFCLGLPLEGDFAVALESAPSWGYFLMPRGPAYQRRIIDLPASFDDYLKALGAKTRQDLRRQERRLQKEGGTVVCRRYCAGSEVNEFLDLAETVSRQTYQWKLLDMGVRNSPQARRTLGVAATRGWLRCYGLYCGGQPVAFMRGYLHRGTYYSLDIGYDPRWAEWSPGNVLHLHVVRDLIADSPRALRFDFMYGDNSNKERLSTSSRTERNVYIVPDTVKWRLVAGVVSGANALLESLGRLVERRGVKTGIRSWLRRRVSGDA